MKLKNLSARLITLNFPQVVTDTMVRPGDAINIMPAGPVVEVPDALFEGEHGEKMKKYINNLIADGSLSIVTGDTINSVEDALSPSVEHSGSLEDMTADQLREVLDGMGVEHKPQHTSPKLIQLIKENS